MKGVTQIQILLALKETGVLDGRWALDAVRMEMVFLQQIEESKRARQNLNSE